MRANFGYFLNTACVFGAFGFAVLVGAFIVIQKLTKVNYLSEGG